MPGKAGVRKSGRAEKSELAIDSDPEILFERIEKIISDGRWNGRPSVVFWKGRYWLSFSSAVKHIDLDSKILMIRSNGPEPKGWSQPTIVLDTQERCDVECHLLATPDRLFAYIVQEEPVAGKPGDFRAAGTLVIYTEDGESWSEPRPAHDPPWSLWKPKAHRGIHYVAADIMEGGPRLDLLKSSKGLRWEKVSTILEGEYTETALLFLPDDSLLAFTRQGPGPSISHARPPYTQWKVYEGPKMGGPDAVLVDNTILVTGRQLQLRLSRRSADRNRPQEVHSAHRPLDLRPGPNACEVEDEDAHPVWRRRILSSFPGFGRPSRTDALVRRRGLPDC